MAALSALPDPAFWVGRRVLVTGNTGFKGSWLVAWLRELGSEVVGLALPAPVSEPDLWSELELGGIQLRADIRDPGAWQQRVAAFAPQLVFHLAAQSLVPVGYQLPGLTFDTNVTGTVRLLEVLDSLPGPRTVLVVTSDKVYEPQQARPFTESSYLGGADPYSASKAATEFLVHSWPSRSVRLATARAGNVIGGGDWANQRLIPDLVRAWLRDEAVALRAPASVRPWQHVLEPLRGYLLYAQALHSGAAVPSKLNFGPSVVDAVPVAQVVEYASTCLQANASPTAAQREFHETAELLIDSTAARESLGWVGVLNWQEAVAATMDWYRSRRAGRSAQQLVRADLSRYARIVEERS